MWNRAGLLVIYRDHSKTSLFSHVFREQTISCFRSNDKGMKYVRYRVFPIDGAFFPNAL